MSNKKKVAMSGNVRQCPNCGNPVYGNKQFTKYSGWKINRDLSTNEPHVFCKMCAAKIK